MTATFAQADGPPPWRFFGDDVLNRRGHISNGYNVGAAFQITQRTAAKLRLKWSYSTVGDVSATPTAEAGGVYVPDYAGYLYKLDPNTGALVWSKYLADYMGGTYGYSRSSPAIGDLGEIVIGNNSTHASDQPGARLLSIDKARGALNWISIVDSNPLAYVTMSPVIFAGRIYVGLASNEEAAAANIAGFKPSFRGSVVCLDEATGKIVWQRYMVPAGYTGASVWGSSAVIWRTANTDSLIVATGNNTSVPGPVGKCLVGVGSSEANQYACMDPSNYVDAVMSLDLKTGHLNWARRFAGADTWNLACGEGPASACPPPAGLDRDFAQAPNLTFVPRFDGVPDDRGGTSSGYFLGAGEKSGYYRGLNPYNGGLFWATFVGRGEIMWGSAINTDDESSAYVALSNTGHYTNTLAGQNGAKVSWNGGAWAALDIRTGAFEWQVPTRGTELTNSKLGSAAPGPVTFTNRVVFAGSTSGQFVALDCATGNLLWSYNAGGSVLGGPSVYNETLFWGAGATKSGHGSVHKLFAFYVPS